VQVDTPEAVVARPVDDYVRDFVRDVPRGHVLTAGGIMNAPLDASETVGTVADTTHVSDLLPMVVATDRPVAVLDDEGRVCGAVDRLTVLRALADDPTPVHISRR
jgi:glycine betaine/proline transport system ATP-binding protein